MPGPNTLGTPNTNDYLLGRGIGYFSSLDVNQRPKEYRDLGNITEFNLSIESETLEHQSSREGLRKVDKEVVISQKLSVSFSMDETNFENLALYLAGTQNAAPTNSAIAGFAEFEMISEVRVGRWYDIWNSTFQRAYDITAGNLTVKKAPSTTLTLGTDYLLDLKFGRIFFISPPPTLVDGTDDILVTLAAEAGAKTLSEVQALKQTGLQGALKFISTNPADSEKKVEWQFHKMTLKAEGDFALIGDEFAVMQVTGVAESNETAGGVGSPTLTIRTHTDA